MIRQQKSRSSSCRLFSLSFALLAITAVADATTLTVRIVDEVGNPVAARVYLRDAQGKNFFPPGTLVYKKLNWGVSEEHFIAPTGSFSIDLPENSYILRVERGKEYLPVQDRLVLPAAGKVEKTFRLQRWVSMNERGWYSADMHAHVPLADVPSLMNGEDLNVVLPITLWRVSFVPAYRDPLLEETLAKADSSGVVRVAENRWFSVVNEELESDRSSILVSGLGRTPVSLEFPFEQMSQRAHAQGGLVDSEKATSMELPAVAGIGGIDFVGLANNHFWRSNCYTGPWGSWPDHLLQKYPGTCEGFARAGFDIYYALLNLGLPIKLSAGSAYGVQPTPLGWSRIYVHVDGEFNADKWFQAAKSGRSFVTTGPMLLLKVDGLEPGHEYRGSQFPKEVEVELTVISPQPAQNAEIVLNGTVRAIPLASNKNDEYSFSGKTKIVLDSSSWIAARYIAPHGDTLDLAHTSPIYFWDQNRPIPVASKDAEYVLARIESLRREATIGRGEDGSDSTSNIFDTDEIRRRTLEYLARAKKAYEMKLFP